MWPFQHWDFHLCCWPKTCSFNTFLTVWGVTGVGRVESMNWMAWTALSSFPEVIWLIIDCLWWGESLEGQPPGWFSLSPSTSLLILPIVPFPRPVLTCTWWWEYPWNNRSVLFSRHGFDGSGKQPRRWMSQVQHAKLMQIRSHDIVYNIHNLPLPCTGM